MIIFNQDLSERLSVVSLTLVRTMPALSALLHSHIVLEQQRVSYHFHCRCEIECERRNDHNAFL